MNQHYIVAQWLSFCTVSSFHNHGTSLKCSHAWSDQFVTFIFVVADMNKDSLAGRKPFSFGIRSKIHALSSLSCISYLSSVSSVYSILFLLCHIFCVISVFLRRIWAWRCFRCHQKLWKQFTQVLIIVPLFTGFYLVSILLEFSFCVISIMNHYHS